MRTLTLGKTLLSLAFCCSALSAHAQTTQLPDLGDQLKKQEEYLAKQKNAAKHRGISIHEDDAPTIQLGEREKATEKTTTRKPKLDQRRAVSKPPSDLGYEPLPAHLQAYAYINFCSDCDHIDFTEYGKLKEICTQLVAAEIPRIMVIGHTDAVGPAAYNVDLSFRRAQSVAQFIESTCELESTAIDTQGVGEWYLLDKNQPDAGKNRRVEFRVAG